MQELRFSQIRPGPRFLSSTTPGKGDHKDAPEDGGELRRRFGSFGEQLKPLNKARHVSDLLRMSRDNNFDHDDWEE